MFVAFQNAEGVSASYWSNVINPPKWRSRETSPYSVDFKYAMTIYAKFAIIAVVLNNSWTRRTEKTTAAGDCAATVGTTAASE